MLPAEEVGVASSTKQQHAPAAAAAVAAAAPMAAAAPSGAADAAAATKAADPAAAKAAFYAKASRVFDELNALFVTDPNIDELALVQYAHREYFEGKDVSQFDLTVEGPAFVVLEHKLGVAFWCVPYVLKFAQKLFAAERHRLDDAATGVTVAANRTFIAAVAAAGGAAGAATAPAPAPAPAAAGGGAAATGGGGGGGIPAASVANLLHATRALLFVNADNYTAWNARKRLLLLGHVSPAQELKLLDLIFSKHPKSGESWAHRRWVLERHPTFQPVLAAAAAAGGDMKRTAAAAVDLYDTATFQGELRACEKGAELYPQNYYAWTHRLWLLSLVHTAHHVTTELARCKLWTDTHVSDYASYHYRAYVLMRLAYTSARHHSLAGAVASSTASSASSPSAAAAAAAAAALPAAYFPATPLLRGARIGCGDTRPYDQPQASSKAGAAAAAVVSPVPAPMAHPSLHLTKPPSTQCMTCLIWEQEFVAIDKLLVTFPGHETLYAHRRFVLFFYARLLAQHHMPFVMPQQQQQQPASSAAAGAVDTKAAAPAPALPAVAAGTIAPGDATAVKANWLVPLCERECKWAAARVADTTVADYDKQKRHATAYRLYVLHAAIDLMRCHRAALLAPAAAAAADAGAAALAAVDDALKGLLAQQSAAAKECAACAVVPAHVFDALTATWHAAP